MPELPPYRDHGEGPADAKAVLVRFSGLSGSGIAQWIEGYGYQFSWGEIGNHVKDDGSSIARQVALSHVATAPSSPGANAEMKTSGSSASVLWATLINITPRTIGHRYRAVYY